MFFKTGTCKYKIKSEGPNKKITRRTTGARGCYFHTSVYQVISKAGFNLDIISRNMLQETRIVQKVSQVLGSKHPFTSFVYKWQVPSIMYQVSGT